MMRQLNLMCAMCYHGVDGGAICAAGFEPRSCTHFIQAYKCKGGMVWETPVTKELCRECAQKCMGCMEMQVAYGFIDIHKVRHLL